MEAVTTHNDQHPITSLKPTLENFFEKNTPDSVKISFLRLLQCYVLNDCDIRAEVPAKEVALFYDQLIALVDAAYLVHQANRAALTNNGGENHV